jgi:hypothetical protein
MYDKYDFIKLFNYDKNKFIELISDLEVYEDETNLIKINDFIMEIYNDFKDIIPKHRYKDFLLMLFKKKEKPYTLKFEYLIFFDSYHIQSYWNKLLDLDIISFENIIKKYSNINLFNRDLPFDTSMNIIISNENYNISDKIIHKNLLSLTDYSYENIYIDTSKINIMVKYITKTNLYIDLIFDSIMTNSRLLRNTENIDKSELANKIFNEEFISKINIDLLDITNYKFDIYRFELIKKFIMNDIFDDFSLVLTRIYCSDLNIILNIIGLLRLDLLEINEVQLKKIIYYGRFEIFEKLYFFIPYQILDILSKSNIFDIDNIEFDYLDDIWDSYRFDNNDEPVIGIKKHKELLNLIKSICKEKNYNNNIFTDKIKKDWIKIALENQKLKNTQDNEYFIKINELIEIFDIKLDINDKASIKKCIELLDKKIVWDMICFKNDENFLDLLFD